MNSQLIPFIVFGSLLMTTLAIAVISSVVIQKQRQIKNRLQRQEQAFEYSQSLLNTRIEVQESTLNMMAEELHDNIAQMLTGCAMQLAAAAGYMEQERGKTIIKEAQGHIQNLIRDVRMLSHSLSTIMVEGRDIEDAIIAELNRIEAFSNITCSMESDSIHELLPEQRLLLFRTVQEALHNVLKHAQADQIDIAINATDDHYALTIADNGQGFDPDSSRSPASLGLANMQQRIAFLKGSLNIDSAAGKGTTITIQIPLKAADE